MKTSGRFKQIPSSLRIACVYFIFGSIWILFSDKILAAVVSDAATITAIQTYKGWAYVFITACLVYLLVRNMEVRLQKYLQQLEKQNKELVTQMEQISESEKKIRHLLKVLESKNQELESIMYVTSHDLRSPLINIQGFSQELQDSCRNLLDLFELDKHPENHKKIRTIIDDEIPTSLNYITASTSRMSSLLHSLLQVCRLGRENINHNKLNMNELVENINKTLKHIQTRENAEIRISDLPACHGDGKQIEQVFANLIENALKYMHEDRKPIINISGRIEGNNSIYYVEDNGVGIPEKYHNKVFELFHRLDPVNDAEGEGIGLTIAQRIVSRHEGKILIESNNGNEGTRFIVTLPTDSPSQSPQ